MFLCLFINDNIYGLRWVWWVFPFLLQWCFYWHNYHALTQLQLPNWDLYLKVSKQERFMGQELKQFNPKIPLLWNITTITAEISKGYKGDL